MLDSLQNNKVYKVVKNFLSFENEEEAVERGPMTQARVQTGRKVVPITPELNQAMINIKKPRTIEDARESADLLKEGRVVVMNLGQIEKDMAREIVYFLSGTTYALNGDYKKIGNDIFLFTPYGVEVTHLEDIQGKGAAQNKLDFGDL